MGLIQDAITLAKAGYGKTSGALNLIKAFDKEKENLVWTEIVAATADVTNLMWEQPQEITDRYESFEHTKKLCLHSW